MFGFTSVADKRKRLSRIRKKVSQFTQKDEAWIEIFHDEIKTETFFKSMDSFPDLAI